MRSYAQMFPFLLVPIAAAVVVGAAAPAVDHDELELEEAEAFIEFNSTDGDFGIQFFWDGDAWDRMKVAGDAPCNVDRISEDMILLYQEWAVVKADPDGYLASGAQPCKPKRTPCFQQCARWQRV